MIFFCLSDLVIASPAVITINSFSPDVNTLVSTRRQYKLFVKSLGMKIPFLFMTVKHNSCSHLIRISISTEKATTTRTVKYQGWLLYHNPWCFGRSFIFYQRCFGQLGSKTRGFVIGKASRWAGTKTLEIIILGAFLKNKRVFIVLRVKSSVNIWILVNGIQWTRVNLMRLFLWNYLAEKNSSFLVVSTYTKADSFVTYSRLVFEVMCIEKVWDNTGC